MAHLARALNIRKAAVDRLGEADALTSMGWVELSRQQPERALEYLNQALTVRQLIGDRRTEGATLTYIGQAHFDLGQVEMPSNTSSERSNSRRLWVDRRAPALCLWLCPELRELLACWLRMPESIAREAAFSQEVIVLCVANALKRVAVPPESMTPSSITKRSFRSLKSSRYGFHRPLFVPVILEDKKIRVHTACSSTS